MTHIRIRAIEGIWTLRAGGAVLAETKNALELSEGDCPPVIYFPRGDIAMEILDHSEHTSHCPHKGDASYFSIITKSKTLENAAWSYETPHPDVERIKNHLAFYENDNVTIEQV